MAETVIAGEQAQAILDACDREDWPEASERLAAYDAWIRDEVDAGRLAGRDALQAALDEHRRLTEQLAERLAACADQLGDLQRGQHGIGRYRTDGGR